MSMTQVTEQHMVAFEQTEDTTYEVESSRLGFWLMVSMSSLVGVWGTVCLVSGLGSCESLSGLGRVLVTAMTGM